MPPSMWQNVTDIFSYTKRATLLYAEQRANGKKSHNLVLNHILTYTGTINVAKKKKSGYKF